MKKVFSLLGILTFLASVSLAMTGSQIMNEVIKADSNFKTQKIEMHMCIQSKGMASKNYDLVIYVYNKGSSKKYAFIRFISPESIKGLSFLSLGKNEEYLYMPAYHRVQRIAGSFKNSEFAGSDFTYNDLSLLYSKKEAGKYKILINNASEYILEIVPTAKNVQYSKLVMTIEKKHLLPTKVEFYKNGLLYKTMKDSMLTKIQGRWLFKKITLTMANGSSKTTLTLIKTEFNLNIPLNFFSVRTLFMPVLAY